MTPQPVTFQATEHLRLPERDRTMCGKRIPDGLLLGGRAHVRQCGACTIAARAVDGAHAFSDRIETR